MQRRIYRKRYAIGERREVARQGASSVRQARLRVASAVPELPS
jgi:hypothetical protein